AATADAAAGSDAPAFTPGTAESAAPPFGGETVIETTPPADEAPPAGAAPVAIVPGAADLALPPTAADDGLVDDAPADGGPAVVDDGAVLDDLAPADPTAPGALTAGGSLPPAMPTPPGDDAPAVDPLDALRVDPAPPRDTAATGVVDQAELDEALAAAVGGSLVLDDDADDADEPTADEPQQLGAYVGADDLLLRRDPQTGVWRRLPARSTLAPGDRLLVLPLFRTEVVVGSAGRLMLAGGSEATLLSPSEAGDRRANFGLAIPFGRVVLHAGPSGQRVALIVGDQTRMVTLGGASSLAIDVRRLFVPGHDAEREPYPLAATFYLTSGSAEWNDGVQDRSAAGQATWALADSGDGDPTDIGDLPAWISAEPLTGIDRAARDAVYRALAPGEPVSVPLLELSDPRGQGQKLEVRGLAFRSGTYIGQFEPLVKSLADLGDRPRWKERIETLRQAIARDPAALPAIAQALAVQRGEKSVSDLLLMLVGFNSQDVGVTREEVQNGAMVRLINWMDHEDLAYRVLAIHNLNEITGTSYLGGYRPEHLASKRKVGIRFYTDRMERGELRPQTWLPTGWGPR
ncbi:MAG TPA: hypothetical protein PKC18_05650, partial [Lacipirellulaceae bacterium]|nr:hypothetical protein [Lacipirellulaceae bacterium]